VQLQIQIQCHVISRFKITSDRTVVRRSILDRYVPCRCRASTSTSPSQISRSNVSVPFRSYKSCTLWHIHAHVYVHTVRHVMLLNQNVSVWLATPIMLGHLGSCVFRVAVPLRYWLYHHRQHARVRTPYVGLAGGFCSVRCVQSSVPYLLCRCLRWRSTLDSLHI